jgi:hypothetical protein
VEWLFAVGLLVIMVFGLTVIWGAPYVPVHKTGVEAAFKMLNLNKNDLIVDLGSGDGIVLKMAATRGLRAYGYEINPLLCLASRWRCRQHGSKIHIFWRDFWLTDLPDDTKGVFIFSGGPFMKRLSKKLQKEANRLKQPLRVASYGFDLPGQRVVSEDLGMKLFVVKPNM